MSDFSINDCNDAGAYQILRGVKKADVKYDWQKTDDTSIIDLASEKAQGQQNKSAITVALEDFSKATTGFHGSNSSNVNADDSKPGFFRSVAAFFGCKDDNIYRSEQGREIIDKNGSVFQNDLFSQDYAKNGGIQYAKEGDDIYESALNFAKADIGAIEKAYSMAYEEGNSNKKLEYGEIGSYMEYDGDLGKALEEMDLDGNKKKISPEEYASYLIATDGLIQLQNGKSSFSSTHPDGTITTEESQSAQEYKNSDFKKIAQEIYDEHYKD